MNVQDFVSELRKQQVDGLVDNYARLLGLPPEKMKDPEFRELAQFWQSFDEPSRVFLRRLMRLASQNTLASILGVLDNTSSDLQYRFALSATTSSGIVEDLSEDLLNTFWAQEEAAGKVNRAG